MLLKVSRARSVVLVSFIGFLPAFSYPGGRHMNVDYYATACTSIGKQPAPNQASGMGEVLPTPRSKQTEPGDWEKKQKFGQLKRGRSVSKI